MIFLLVAAALAVAGEVAPCGVAPAGMACVPGGPFTRGVDKGSVACTTEPVAWHCAGRNAYPAEKVTLSTYYIDLTEVTVEAFQACIAAGECRKAGPNYNDFDRPKQPITGINWHDAVQYCKAQGKHLPTEAEWEKAARGPDGDLQPWGSAPATCELAVIRDDRGRSCGTDKASYKPEVGRVFEVGSRPAGRYGLFDMVGNAQEWVYDWYSASYEACGDACRGTDPKGPCAGAEPCEGHDQRGLRGGSWYWFADHANGVDRRSHFPKNEPFHHYGFRCAASVAEAEALATKP